MEGCNIIRLQDYYLVNIRIVNICCFSLPIKIGSIAHVILQQNMLAEEVALERTLLYIFQITL